MWIKTLNRIIIGLGIIAVFWGLTFLTVAPKWVNYLVLNILGVTSVMLVIFVCVVGLSDHNIKVMNEWSRKKRKL